MLTPRYVIEALDALTHTRDVIRVTEVGQNQLWAAQYSKVTQPRSFLTSGGLGAMGFGLPAAIGACIARPDALVINISGDGSLQMNVAELATITQEQLPLLIVVLNNGGLGLVRQWQRSLYGDRLTASDMDPETPELVDLATAYHIVAFKVWDDESFDAVLEEALAFIDIGRAVLIDCRIDPEVEVLTHG